MEAIEKQLTPQSITIDREFWGQLYQKAFHTGPVLKNHNYIAMSYLHQHDRAALKFWIDLDRIATQINNHFEIKPAFSFKVLYRSKACYSLGGIRKTSYTVNSEDLSTESFMFQCILESFQERKLALLGLAFVSFFLAKRNGITDAYAVAGSSVLLGATAFGMFKSLTGLNTKKVAPISDQESNSTPLEECFQAHFSLTT